MKKEERLKEFVLKIVKEVVATSQLPIVPDNLSIPITFTMQDSDWKQITTFITSQIEIFETLQKRIDQASADKELVDLFDISILLILLSSHVKNQSGNLGVVMGFLDVLCALCLTQNQVHEHFVYFLVHLATTDEGATYIMKSVDVKIFLFKLPWQGKILPLRETLLKVHTIMNISKISHLRRKIIGKPDLLFRLLIEVQIVPLCRVLTEHLLKWTDIFATTTDTSLLENELIGDFGYYLIKILRNLNRSFSNDEKERWFGVVYNDSQLLSKLRMLFGRESVYLKIRLSVLDLMTHSIYETNTIKDLPNTIYSDRNLLLHKLKELITEIQSLPIEDELPFEKCMYHVFHALQTVLSKLPPLSGYEVIRPFQDFFMFSTCMLDDPTIHTTHPERIQLELCFVCFQNILKGQVPLQFTQLLLPKIKNVCRAHLNGSLGSMPILIQAVNTLCNLLGHDLGVDEDRVHLISLLYRLLFSGDDNYLNCLVLRCLSNLCYDEESAGMVFDMGYPKILDFCQLDDRDVFIDAIYLVSLVMKYDRDFLKTTVKPNQLVKLYQSVYLYLESTQVSF